MVFRHQPRATSFCERLIFLILSIILVTMATAKRSRSSSSSNPLSSSRRSRAGSVSQPREEDPSESMVCGKKMCECMIGIPCPAGINGIPGTNGIHGRNGKKGDRGSTGSPGKDGLRGSQGRRGKKGDSGPSGLEGPVGPAGRPGPPGRRTRHIGVRVAFSVGRSSPLGPVGQDTVVRFDKIFSNVGRRFDEHNSQFIAGHNGTYVFHLSVVGQEGVDAHAWLMKNAKHQVAVYGDGKGGFGSGSATIILDLIARDRVSVQLSKNSALRNDYTLLTGYLLYEN